MRNGSLLALLVVACVGTPTSIDTVKRLDYALNVSPMHQVAQTVLVGTKRGNRIRACNRIKDPIARKRCMSRK